MGTQIGERQFFPFRQTYPRGTDEGKNKGSDQEDWSRRVDLNHRPSDYESLALPLSYAGP